MIEQNYFSVAWRYSVSMATGESVVPFYLQETIGGSDIDNQPSPCKPGIIRTVCTHLGFLLAYDAGQVALHRSDFDISQMRQSFGGGVSIYLGKDVIFRMAVALGGGEGTHPYFSVGNFI